MGQAAEDMQNGTCCCMCGVWNDAIEDAPVLRDENGNVVKHKGVPVLDWAPPGHPWTCDDCLEDAR